LAQDLLELDLTLRSDTVNPPLRPVALLFVPEKNPAVFSHLVQQPVGCRFGDVHAGSKMYIDYFIDLVAVHLSVAQHA
jgi:hypothetical protein